MGFELKKVFDPKSLLLFLVIIILAIGLTMVMKPTLDTENRSIDEKTNSEIIDEREPEVIGEEVFLQKISIMEGFAKSTLEEKEAERVLGVVAHVRNFSYVDTSFFQAYSKRLNSMPILFAMLVMILLVTTKLFSYEKEQGTLGVILATKGKYKWQNNKIKVAMIVSLSTVLLWATVLFFLTMIQYGPPTNGDYSVVRILDNPVFINKSYTIHFFVLMKLIYIAFIFFTLGLVGTLFSGLTRNTLSTTVLTMILILGGKVLSLIPLFPEKIRLIFAFNNYYDFLKNIDSHVLSTFYYGKVDIMEIGNIGAVFILLMAAVGLQLCIRKGEK